MRAPLPVALDDRTTARGHLLGMHLERWARQFGCHGHAVTET